MAKISELRIGNLLRCKLTHAILKVVEINEKGFSTEVLDRSQFPLPDGWSAEAIPLTEELLDSLPEVTRCVYHPETWRIRDPRSQFHIVKNKDRFVFRGAGMSVIYVDTLHHLQNLVFVNTGKELELS